MNISRLQSALSRYGVDDDSFGELARLAEQIDGTFIEPQLPGIDETDSAVLVSHLLRKLAPALDVVFEHPDVVADVNFAVVEPMQPSYSTAVEEHPDHRYASGNAG